MNPFYEYTKVKMTKYQSNKMIKNVKEGSAKIIKYLQRSLKVYQVQILKNWSFLSMSQTMSF